jgi:hypothetical protein
MQHSKPDITWKSFAERVKGLWSDQPEAQVDQPPSPPLETQAPAATKPKDPRPS